MEPEVRAEYEALLRLIVLRDGTLVDATDTRYGWIATDYDHVAGPSGCPVSSTAVPQETVWYEFAGAFDGSRAETGTDLAGVGCACGLVVNRVMRLRETVSDMAEKVFEELYRQSRGDVTE